MSTLRPGLGQVDPDERARVEAYEREQRTRALAAQQRARALSGSREARRGLAERMGAVTTRNDARDRKNG